MRLVIADRYPVVLEGLDRVFESVDDIRVMSRCATAAEVIAAVREHRPHVLLYDPRLPGTNGLTVLHGLREQRSTTKVVLFADTLSDDETIEALRLSVHGIVLKQQPLPQLVDCLRKVHANGIWIERELLGHALNTLLRRAAGGHHAAAVLTPREVELVRMVARGLTTDAIAGCLAISTGTVKVHLHHIYRKLNVDGRVGLVLYAQQKQLI